MSSSPQASQSPPASASASSPDKGKTKKTQTKLLTDQHSLKTVLQNFLHIIFLQKICTKKTEGTIWYSTDTFESFSQKGKCFAVVVKWQRGKFPVWPRRWQLIVDPVIKYSVKRSPMNDGNDGSLMKFKHEVQTREARDGSLADRFGTEVFLRWTSEVYKNL